MPNTTKPHLANIKLKPAQLSDLYLPYIKGGAIFLPGLVGEYHLGEEVFVKIDLEGSAEPYRIVGNVVVVASDTDPKDYPPGVGVQFQDEQGAKLNEEIKTMISTLAQKDH